jgi:ribosome-binding protein aMBF1 (putative translation factor)
MKGDCVMSSYNDLKKQLLDNPKVKAEYDALEPEFNIIQAMIDARKQQNLTQEELSKKTGITQADISRIENGTRNPSLEMVKRLARGLGMQLRLELIPQPEKR